MPVLRSCKAPIQDRRPGFQPRGRLTGFPTQPKLRRPSAQVDRRRQRHREHDPGIAVVVRRAAGSGPRPCRCRRSRARRCGTAARGGYSRPRPMSPAPTLRRPSRRSSRSTTCGSCRPTSAPGVVLDPRGALLAGPEALAEPARDLLEAAGDARELQVTTADGGVYAARSEPPRDRRRVRAPRAALADPLRPAARARRPRRRRAPRGGLMPRLPRKPSGAAPARRGGRRGRRPGAPEGRPRAARGAHRPRRAPAHAGPRRPRRGAAPGGRGTADFGGPAPFQGLIRTPEIPQNAGKRPDLALERPMALLSSRRHPDLPETAGGTRRSS